MQLQLNVLPIFVNDMHAHSNQHRLLHTCHNLSCKHTLPIAIIELCVLIVQPTNHSKSKLECFQNSPAKLSMESNIKNSQFIPINSRLFPLIPMNVPKLECFQNSPAKLSGNLPENFHPFATLSSDHVKLEAAKSVPQSKPVNLPISPVWMSIFSSTFYCSAIQFFHSFFISNAVQTDPNTPNPKFIGSLKQI